MKRLLFLLLPVVCGVLVFFLVTFILSQKDAGKGALQVTSVPQSSVYVNDKFIGQTPLCKCDGQSLLPTGDYTIRLVPTDPTLSNQPFEQKITINKSVLTVVDRTFGPGATGEGSVIFLSPQQNGDTKSGTIMVNSLPSGITVNLDGNPIGQTPLTFPHVVESDHDLLLTKTGYKEKTIRIHTVNGLTLSVIAFLGIDPNAISATGSATQVTASTSAVQVAKVTILDTPTGFLNVRNTPSLGGSVIAQVKPGESYPLLSDQDGWTQIKLTNGTEGWVSSTYVQKQ